VDAVEFYRDVLGAEPVEFGGRTVLNFGRSKINLYQVGNEFEPKAVHPSRAVRTSVSSPTTRSTTSSQNLSPTSCRERRDGSPPLGTPVEYARVDCQ
jgi:hypothetical protein